MKKNTKFSVLFVGVPLKGCTSIETIPSPGRPNEISTRKIMNNIHDIILNSPKVTVHEIAEIICISSESVVIILHRHLCLRKLCAKCRIKNPFPW